MPLRIYPSAQKDNSEKFASPRAVHRRFIAARYGIGRVGLFLEHPPLLSRVARWFPWACPFFMRVFTSVLEGVFCEVGLSLLLGVC
jgi:hypothetical protein